MSDFASSLLEALESVIDATNEHDRARDAYDGYSWGYFGASLIHERDKARRNFVERLDALVDERVRVILTERGGPA